MCCGSLKPELNGSLHADAGRVSVAALYYGARMSVPIRFWFLEFVLCGNYYITKGALDNSITQKITLDTRAALSIARALHFLFTITAGSLTIFI